MEEKCDFYDGHDLYDVYAEHDWYAIHFPEHDNDETEEADE